MIKDKYIINVLEYGNFGHKKTVHPQKCECTVRYCI